MATNLFITILSLNRFRSFALMYYGMFNKQLVTLSLGCDRVVQKRSNNSIA